LIFIFKNKPIKNLINAQKRFPEQRIQQLSERLTIIACDSNKLLNPR